MSFVALTCGNCCLPDPFFFKFAPFASQWQAFRSKDRWTPHPVQTSRSSERLHADIPLDKHCCDVITLLMTPVCHSLLKFWQKFPTCQMLICSFFFAHVSSVFYWTLYFWFYTHMQTHTHKSRCTYYRFYHDFFLYDIYIYLSLSLSLFYV